MHTKKSYTSTQNSIILTHNTGHLYHDIVLENNRAPCSNEVIPPDPNAPELPPPLESDPQDNDTPSVYQDITEIPCKHNKFDDSDKSERCCYQELHDLNSNSENAKLYHE